MSEASPESILAHLGPGESALFRCDFNQWYLPEQPSLALLVAAWRCPDSKALSVVLSDQPDCMTNAGELSKGPCSRQELQELAEAWQAPLLDLSRTLLLEPVAIAKPWGREIWYTGMEARGLSAVTDGRYSIPLAWLLGLLPEQLMGMAESGDKAAVSGPRAPNLLKILDPLPEPVYGDLYFELHEQKREVYVVTHVDHDAWPEGVGGIRYGFDPALRAGFADEAGFRDAYLRAVGDYRALRVELDTLIDALRLRDSVGLNEPVPAEQTRAWQAELPSGLCAREVALRAKMDAFTRMKPLRVGDVVKVPLLMPHALQHGVRAVEFQTPVYERKILSFAQKVLTQGHWDSADAVAIMAPDPEEDDNLELLGDDGLIRREQIVRFQDFEVQRVILQPRALWRLPTSTTYSLMMLVQGNVEIGELRLEPEQAVFLPARCATSVVASVSPQPSVLLLSRPPA